MTDSNAPGPPMPQPSAEHEFVKPPTDEEFRIFHYVYERAE